jgi:hypothetical protein
MFGMRRKIEGEWRRVKGEERRVRGVGGGKVIKMMREIKKVDFCCFGVTTNPPGGLYQRQQF